MVNFCEKCGSLLIPERRDDGIVKLFCKTCKAESKEKFKDASYQVKSKIDHTVKDRLTVIEEEFDIRPIIRVACPKCNFAEARYWEAEDRRKEEWETTTYYQCVKCNWVWSE
jgi:transcription factor S